MKSKIFGSILGFGMVLAAASPGFAADRVRIIDTGAQSWNIGAIVRLKKTQVNNPQTANVTNNVTSNVNSGHNEVKYNTKVLGDVSTGKADSFTDVLTDVNNSDIEVNGCGCENDTNVLIDQTGYQSKNIAVVVDAQEIQVNNRQEARVVNNVNTNANSGHNTTNYNTKVDGGVSSGNAVSTTIVTTYANNSTIKVNP